MWFESKKYRKVFKVKDSKNIKVMIKKWKGENMHIIDLLLINSHLY